MIEHQFELNHTTSKMFFSRYLLDSREDITIVLLKLLKRCDLYFKLTRVVQNYSHVRHYGLLKLFAH